jgi:hypothetical protein
MTVLKAPHHHENNVKILEDIYIYIYIYINAICEYGNIYFYLKIY